jgi:hypothetical protein
MKSWTSPTNEMLEKVLSSVKKETDRQYFFLKLKNPLWIEPLRKRGYFNNPPKVKQLPEGNVQYPNWPELNYLVNMAKETTDEIIDIVLNLPKTDNPRVYNYIIDIALNVEGRKSAKMLPKVIEFTEIENRFFAYRYPEILHHWINQGNIHEALVIVKKLVPFIEDPKYKTKLRFRKNKNSKLEASLEPSPRFEQWDYQQILEKGIRPLADKEPYQVARILIDATSGMIRMRMHPDDLEKKQDEDNSEIWCRRLDKPGRRYQDVKEILVHTLTYACEKVFEIAPESIESLDQALRNQPWKLFKRLRQHLYASYPNDQTLPWICEMILDHIEYSKWEYHYELQLMIRKSSEFFGYGLLSEAEKMEIFQKILNGPPKEDYRQWLGDEYSEDAYNKRQRYFHRMQLRPFATLLRGEYRRYFDELEKEEQGETVSDDSYLPYGRIKSGWVTHQSPKSLVDLEKLSDGEILAFLNGWNERYRDKNNWLVEYDVSALAGEFQTLFKERIVPDKERLGYWMMNREKIARPIYVVAMVKAMMEIVKDRCFDNLDQWMEFCAWIVSHPDSERVEGRPRPNEESSDHPDWGRPRRAVVDFIEVCLKKDTSVTIAVRDDLANLLQQVCIQFDWWLDCDRPVVLNHDDQITEAINKTRSRALEALINFGFWVRRYLPEDPVSEVTDILSERLAKEELPLTRPERALLGMQFGSLCSLNQAWAINQKKVLFPQEEKVFWHDAFGSFIRFNRPGKQVFEILREDFEYALDNLDDWMTSKDDDRNYVDRLGQHIFTYYLWKVFPLTGAESLLERFYEKTSKERQRWANLFDHVGRSLRNSPKHLEKSLIDRAIAYFNWRFDSAEPMELQQFTFWLEAECLGPEWRLQSYLKILDHWSVTDMGLSIELKTLNKLHPKHLPLVVECLAKITGHLKDLSINMYIPTDEVKPILKAGLNAEDQKVCENAEHVRENFLRSGRFEFLDME